ncbi:MAG: hypothetical protein ABSG46_01270 [Candidatus Binataceae bacterium]|jgi:hypothetical protein
MDKRDEKRDKEIRNRKAELLDREFLTAVEANLTEWNSPEDGAAYSDL